MHMYACKPWPWSERHAIRECAHKPTCPSQKGSTVRLSPSSAVVGTWLAGTYSGVTVDDCVQCRLEDIPHFRRECGFSDQICIYRVVIDILSSQLKWSRLVQRAHRLTINSSVALSDRGEGG